MGTNITEMKSPIKQNACLLAIVTGIFALLVNTEVLAASADTTRQPVAGSGLLIAFAIAYLSRRRAIGGWLLYFYIQLYLGLLISLLFISQVVSNLDPNQWEDSFQYVMFFLSVAPVVITQFLEMGVATILLFQRNESIVKLLRKTLYALVATSAAALAIDISYFSDTPSIFIDALTLVFAIIWSLYFLKARRIQLVFIERNWIFTPFSERRALSQDDKRKLRNRALLSALVTFVLLLLMMGSTLQGEGKQPDIGIFAVPLFYAAIAAIVAWYLPLKKKKEEAKPVLDTESAATKLKMD